MSLKKKIAGVLLATMCTAFFAGCGGDNKSADSTSGKKVQIEYWHVASESFGGQTVKELVKDFNEKHPDIEVVEKYNPDMYKGLTQNLQAAIASGKNPDVVQMGWSYLNYAAENLKYQDINEAFEKSNDKNFLKDNFLPNVLALAQTDDGKQIGVPYSISVPVLYYNPEIFKAAGLDPANPPKTWNEVKAAAKQIKDKTGNMGFFMQEYADNWTQQALIESNGGSMLKKVDEVVFEEFKGTGNMELVLDRRMAERRIFPAVDIIKSGTRREEKLFTPEELECNYALRRMAATLSNTDMTDGFFDLMKKTKNNQEFMERLPVWEKMLGLQEK